MLEEPINTKTLVTITLRIIATNLVAWMIVGGVGELIAKESQLLSSILLLLILVPLGFWDVLSKHGDWALGWVGGFLGSIGILCLTILLAISLSFLFFPATCLIVIVVVGGAGAGFLALSNALPQFPGWVFPPIAFGLLYLLFTIPIFVLSETASVLFLAILGGLSTSLLPLLNLITHIRYQRSDPT